MGTRRVSRRASFSGFTIVEMAVVLAIVTLTMTMFARTLSSSTKLDPVATETAIAASGARTLLEELKNHPFEQMYASYNASPDDDPNGPGTAPGNHFAIEGLAPLTAGGIVGTIEFPSVGSTLREDVTDDELGMPRDLNGDGLIDTADHKTDCILLPIRVRVDWMSRSGVGARRGFELFTMFARY